VPRAQEPGAPGAGVRGQTLRDDRHEMGGEPCVWKDAGNLVNLDSQWISIVPIRGNSIVAKRPKHSRWRRLPGVYRFGDKSRPEAKLEPERLTLYLPWELLDAAEAQAAQAGIGTIQEYCTLLLQRALETERIRTHMAEIEAQHGPLAGLHEIADDPEYLAEWSAQAQAQAHDRSEPVRIDPPASTVPLVVPFTAPDPFPPQPGPTPAPASGDVAAEESPAERLSPAAEVVIRHAVPGGDDATSFLACLRRGESLPLAEVAELARALHVLEAESRTARVLDRRVVHALHRLAFESQVLHTDAWPGAFDEWTVDTLRAVQEAVDRILSGQDIRYYSAESRPEIPL
jgi:hypothetical protein